MSGPAWDGGGYWDGDWAWDTGTIQPYLDLITSEHRKRPKFIEALSYLLAPLADNQFQASVMYDLFDLDTAVGSQLDVVGQWVGISRQLAVPLVGIYFSLDEAGLGFDEGTWKGPFDPDSYLIDLPDDSYRLLLRARVLNNKWNGTIPQAYEIWDALFAGTGFGLLLQDFGNMHMLYALTGPVPDAVTLALFLGGYLNNRPAGVKVDGYMAPSVDNAPYFGFDVSNASIDGFDVGAWGTLYVPA